MDPQNQFCEIHVLLAGSMLLGHINKQHFFPLVWAEKTFTIHLY